MSAALINRPALEATDWQDKDDEWTDEREHRTRKGRTVKNVPMPNEKIDGRTIIASVPWSDEPPVNEWSVLLLHSDPPFFQCARINADTSDILAEGERHANIVPAVDEYVDQWGGDY